MPFQGLDKIYNENALCPHSDANFANWYWYTMYSVLGGFALIWSALCMRLLSVTDSSKRVPYIVAFNIVTMGTIATVLALFWNWGGVCIDVLGVASPGAIWAEWIACGPMLVFITVTMVDKPSLTSMDWFIMVNFWLCLVAGLAIVPQQPYGWAVFWLVVSCLTYLPCLYLPFYDSTLDCLRYLEHTYNKSALTHEWSDDELGVIAERRAKQFNIAVWLTIALPLYTVNYLVALWGGIDVVTTIVIYQVLLVQSRLSGEMFFWMSLVVSAH